MLIYILEWLWCLWNAWSNWNWNGWMVGRLGDYWLQAAILLNFLPVKLQQVATFGVNISLELCRGESRIPSQKKKKIKSPKPLQGCFFYFCRKEICILSIRGIHREPDLKALSKIHGAKLGDSQSDFSTPPPTSCWSINSNISLWPRGGKTPCILVLCRVHVAISGCVYAAPAWKNRLN